MLLGSGADPNAKGVNNVSGLIWAAGRGHEDVVRLLLEKGAKVSDDLVSSMSDART